MNAHSPSPGVPPDVEEREAALGESKPGQAQLPAKRYESGLNVSEAPLGPDFDQLPLAIRYEIYLRERAVSPATPGWNLETRRCKERKLGG